MRSFACRVEGRMWLLRDIERRYRDMSKEIWDILFRKYYSPSQNISRDTNLYNLIIFS